MQNKQDLEKKSAAITLSDMEIFVFPELMYSLVLANIMSPRIWAWRDDPWFKGIRKMRPYRRLQRLKQFIMDNYVFNLDLDTWGMTNQSRELERFAATLSPEMITQSNALFGYQGDKYYFDIDIRTHFGLDKYDQDVIPYWKTETVEAMDAFCHREGYSTGAGECVSLAALYAAALYIVCGIPLEKIYLMATPLHSQNFVDLDEGILINNRRLVTKAMWFNGTHISGQARRALENERVTIVSHLSGWIHTLYPRATIDPQVYDHFSRVLHDYLHTPLTPEILGNFLRQTRCKCRDCFVLRHSVRGVDKFISLEAAFSFEHECPYKVTDHTRGKLLELIPQQLFSVSHCPGCVVLNDLELLISEHALELENPTDIAILRKAIGENCVNSKQLVDDLIDFCHTKPRLPARTANFEAEKQPLELPLDMEREAVIAYLEGLRSENTIADMAFYAWRDLTRVSPAAFIKAALERNPVVIEHLGTHETPEVVAALQALPNASIYDGPARLAQPDEVWTFKRGDGWEKALTLATVMRARGVAAMRLCLEHDAQDGAQAVLFEINGAAGEVELGRFATAKQPREQVWHL